MKNSAIVSFPLYFSSLSCEHTQESIDRPNGFHSEQLMFILEGEGVLSIDDKEYRLYPNTAVFLGTDVSHSYRGTDDNFKTAWITFRGDLLLFLHAYFNVGKSMVCYNIDTQKYLSMLRELELEYTTNASESLMSAMTYRLLTEFFSTSKGSEHNAIEKAELYIIRNFSKRIYLDELANVLGISKSKLCVMAKEYWNMTAFEKINDIRLMHAKRILEKNKSIKLSECAKQCGFEDTSYFCYCYKKKFGATPKNKKQA